MGSKCVTTAPPWPLQRNDGHPTVTGGYGEVNFMLSADFSDKSLAVPGRIRNHYATSINVDNTSCSVLRVFVVSY